MGVYPFAVYYYYYYYIFRFRTMLITNNNYCPYSHDLTGLYNRRHNVGTEFLTISYKNVMYKLISQRIRTADHYTIFQLAPVPKKELPL
jgi:hypothetical protein